MTVLTCLSLSSVVALLLLSLVVAGVTLSDSQCTRMVCRAVRETRYSDGFVGRYGSRAKPGAQESNWTTRSWKQRCEDAWGEPFNSLSGDDIN
eukprot:403464-Hanusia_phi.AAC.3